MSVKYRVFILVGAVVWGLMLTGCGGEGVLPSEVTQSISSDTRIEGPPPIVPQNIILSTQDVSCPVGGEMSLDISVEPADASNALTITSNDPTIANIDSDGNIIARQRGTAVVTISSELNPDVSASVTVSVSATYESLGITTEVVENQEMGLRLKMNSEMVDDSEATFIIFRTHDRSSSYVIYESSLKIKEKNQFEAYREIYLFNEKNTIYKHKTSDSYYAVNFSISKGEKTKKYLLVISDINYEQIEAFINELEKIQ